VFWFHVYLPQGKKGGGLRPHSDNTEDTEESNEFLNIDNIKSGLKIHVRSFTHHWSRTFHTGIYCMMEGRPNNTIILFKLCYAFIR
jgi:hypothetical protein